MAGQVSVKTFGFGLRAFKKFPELIPLVSIISTACLGAAGFIGYALATKPDVRLVRSRGPAHESVKPTQATKLRVLHPEYYKPIPELEALRKEIGSYKS